MTVRRASEAAVQDVHDTAAWKAALAPLGASTALELGGVVVVVEYAADAPGGGLLRLHVPALGDAHDDTSGQDAAIREALAAAAELLDGTGSVRPSRHDSTD